MSCFSHIQVSTCCLHYRCHKLGKRCACLFGELEATFVSFEYKVALNVVCFIIMMLLYSDQFFCFLFFIIQSGIIREFSFIQQRELIFRFLKYNTVLIGIMLVDFGFPFLDCHSNSCKNETLECFISCDLFFKHEYIIKVTLYSI